MKPYFELCKISISLSNRLILKEVDLTIFEGEILGLMGPSGSGKSTLGKLLLKLCKPTSGVILKKGKDIETYNKSEMKNYRKKVQMIFQNPYSSLNPKMTVEQHLKEPLWIHYRNQDKNEVAKLMDQVRLPIAFLKRYPKEMSGGERQRVAIARALAVKPEFIVCDEPLSALDIFTQREILHLLKELQVQNQLSYLFISHDPKSLAKFADRVHYLS